ncbi:Ribonuclease H2 subunit B [Temnothorax longispinosus]|uniref:Ribonuclease H2 subunit B n=1 Tax=Temnothorax longispinosus TaxID=300112 RepID=A0A4S2KE33_9HYME|nr:Ribonuclease H2 subunit B [Temnothorax longispinosus]
MPRAKSLPQKLVKVASCHPSASTWVFLMKEDTLDSTSGGQPEIVKLRHPASDKPAVFAFSPGNLTVQEVLIFDEKKRSWFIDNNVKSDGKLHLSTPIDPIFLALPYLRKSQMAQPLEQCLWDEDFPETSRLVQCENLNLSLVADRKGDESLQAFKFNEEKSLNWLRKKVEKVAHVLQEKGVHVSQGAMSATYVKSTKYESGTEAGHHLQAKDQFIDKALIDENFLTEYLKYAHGIVSEYLAEDLSKKLAQRLNISDEVENKKRKLTSPKNETDEKKLKKDSVEESPVSKTKKQTKELSKPEKSQKSAAPGKKELARQRAAAGSKSITSFFQKK